MELNKYELFQQGIYIDNMTSRHDISKLITSLYPVKISSQANQNSIDLTRVGGGNDGGYLLPNDLENISACFSPGVDLTASFEIDLLEKFNIHSHLADYSVDRPPMNFIPKSFTKKFLGNVNDDIFITLDSWVETASEFTPASDFILQMDIEGSEYSSILGVSEAVLQKFRIITIEIHNVESWGQRDFFDLLVTPFFNKILKHFYVVHNHPNNCCGIVNLGGILAPRVFELTLLRKDRGNLIGFCQQFPHPLDGPNLLDREDLTLPKNWFMQN